MFLAIVLGFRKIEIVKNCTIKRSNPQFTASPFQKVHACLSNVFVKVA